MSRTHDIPIIAGEPVHPHIFAGMPRPESVEQMCRNLIEQGIRDSACRRYPGSGSV